MVVVGVLSLFGTSGSRERLIHVYACTRALCTLPCYIAEMRVRSSYMVCLCVDEAEMIGRWWFIYRVRVGLHSDFKFEVEAFAFGARRRRCAFVVFFAE